MPMNAPAPVFLPLQEAVGQEESACCNDLGCKYGRMGNKLNVYLIFEPLAQ